MKSRNWVKLFFSTLAIGGVVTAIIGFAIKWNEYEALFIHFKFIEILATLIWLIGVGFLFSMISQAGFFAYLTVHQFGLGIFKSAWKIAQVALILFVLFDIVFFRYQFYAKKSDSILPYIGYAVFIVIVAAVIAYLKVKQTNKGAFIPALFFMIVVTVIEWFPVIRTNDKVWLLLMLIPLLICNAYQLLMLPRFIENKKEKTVKA